MRPPARSSGVAELPEILRSSIAPEAAYMHAPMRRTPSREGADANFGRPRFFPRRTRPRGNLGAVGLLARPCRWAGPGFSAGRGHHEAVLALLLGGIQR